MNVGVHVVNARPWATADSIVSLGTRVLALPYRQPLVVAKQWATLDAFSGGRTILGVGAGFMREQFEALGMDTFDRQGEATDEAIRLLRAVWAQGAEVSFTGDVYRFQPVRFLPTPRSRGGCRWPASGASTSRLAASCPTLSSSRMSFDVLLNIPIVSSEGRIQPRCPSNNLAAMSSSST